MNGEIINSIIHVKCKLLEKGYGKINRKKKPLGCAVITKVVMASPHPTVDYFPITASLLSFIPHKFLYNPLCIQCVNKPDTYQIKVNVYK